MRALRIRHILAIKCTQCTRHAEIAIIQTVDGTTYIVDLLCTDHLASNQDEAVQKAIAELLE